MEVTLNVNAGGLVPNADPKSLAEVQTAISRIDDSTIDEAVRAAVAALANQKDPSAVMILWQAYNND